MFLRYLRKLLSWQLGGQVLAPVESEVDELADGVMPIRWGDRRFVITDKYGRLKRRGKGHWGSDLMTRRNDGSKIVALPGKTKHYECPTGVVEARCCLAGVVVRVLDDKKNGGAIYVDHGRFMSVYRHLDQDFKDLWPAKGQSIPKGTVIGIVGHAPSAGKKGINHLHFELWDTDKAREGHPWDRRRQAIDPGPHLAKWAGR